MKFEHIRHHYGVPAEIGRRVIVDGKSGVIAECRGNYIGVLFDSDKPNRIINCHPTWQVEYQGLDKVRKMTASQKRYQEYIKSDSDYTFAEWIGVNKKS